uniref:Uncharacterized protein n=1 Tax=Romanomermis culicivorax TaxID=13658 RepID=A0A915IDV6_ROMCU
MKVKSVHIHPAYLDSMSHQPQSRTVHNIAIIVMRLKVKASTRIAQPIQFPLHPVPLDSNFLIATWNVSGGDTRLPLYEVPVEINRAAIESAKNPKKLLTRRLHLIGDDKFDNELVGRPLLAYNEQSENFTLAGFYSGTIGKRSNEQVEIHVTVYPHIQWIRETLTSLLTTKKDKKNRSINKL